MYFCIKRFFCNGEIDELISFISPFFIFANKILKTDIKGVEENE